MSVVKFLNVEAKPGEKAFNRVPVGELPDGNMLEIPVHLANGTKPGPIMLITNALHGDALSASETIRQFYLNLNTEGLSGAVAVIPVCNPLAAAADRRHTPQDGWNMNRVFPARLNDPHNPGWVTQQMAAVATEAVDQADMLLDFHSGSDSIIHYIYARTTDPEKHDHSLEVAQMYGFKCIYAGTPVFSGTITDYAASQGKDALLIEHGGIGIPQYCVQEATRGIYNILKYKGMLSGKPELPKEQIVIRDKQRPLLRPRNGGWFVPAIGADKLNNPVPKGAELGRIVNLYNFKDVEVLYAPCEETIPLMMKILPSKMYPGDYTYIVGDGKTALRLTN
ncbi:MAG: succinylglutamate desuccinylase/aspartoacylase family protein [Anaerolineaceae bacterium]|nr:succinylglutamate desuccinylase/aspartoacylase family protein [Anaerolineaceae bacterium]